MCPLLPKNPMRMTLRQDSLYLPDSIPPPLSSLLNYKLEWHLQFSQALWLWKVSINKPQHWHSWSFLVICKEVASSVGREAQYDIFVGGGSDSISGSLEDLVSNFDEKLTMCFQDYQEQVLRFLSCTSGSNSLHQVDKIAPVQIRSQEEIMNECQVLSINNDCPANMQE